MNGMTEECADAIIYDADRRLARQLGIAKPDPMVLLAVQLPAVARVFNAACWQPDEAIWNLHYSYGSRGGSGRRMYENKGAKLD